MAKNRKIPGVYITELDAFPPSVVGVQTAVPAFIGYTQTAVISGKPVYNQAIKINSLVEYEAIFGNGFRPLYDIESVPSTGSPPNADSYDFLVKSAGSPPEMLYYRLVPITDSKFHLYESMRLFYDNGGGTCYVVSVGDYTADGTQPGGVLVEGDTLEGGLDVIANQVGPTMLVIPDATLLPATSQDPPGSAAFQKLVRKMLRQCGDLEDRVAIFDVYGTTSIDPNATSLQTEIDGVITQFRDDVGDEFLNYGMAYFPFLSTSVVQVSEIDYTTINLEDHDQRDLLQQILTDENKDLYGGGQATQVQGDIDKISPDNTEDEIKTVNQNLTTALPVLVDIETIIAEKINVLPPSGAMAGVYTLIDGTRGVWNAPANTTLASVVAPTLAITDAIQADLNVPVDGKAVDVIREFTGRGTVVWGARTLDGNSNDHRYIQVRRTLIYIEQSIKAALNPFVFAPNVGNTWVTVTSMVSSFLQGVWNQGGLMGATAAEAFSVECGLGSTMTGQDILEGYMIVQVVLQMVRPAEFIELTFKQKMEGVG